MKKGFGLAVAFVAAGIATYFYLNNRPTHIIAVHQNEFVASVLVDRLPLSDSKRIAWWLRNKETISTQYHITSIHERGAKSVYIYAFGEGYLPEEDKDRLCFEDMPGPKNCIDKNILMMVLRTRDGAQKFIFDDAVYVKGRDGKLVEKAQRE